MTDHDRYEARILEKCDKIRKLESENKELRKKLERHKLSGKKVADEFWKLRTQVDKATEGFEKISNSGCACYIGPLPRVIDIAKRTLASIHKIR